MKVWLLDTEKFVSVNNLKEVTDSMLFNLGNVPAPGGLFSTDIFGTTSEQRKTTFAYIDLHQYYLSPKIYITLKRLNRNFEAIIYSTKKFIIDSNGILVENENGGTGLKWLYDNWEKIKFQKNDSNQRNERVDLITNNKKNTLFIKKFIVIPAFYRDVNIQSTDSNPKVPEINDLYAKIIRNTKTIQSANTMDIIIAAMQGKIQDLIVDVYNLLKDKIQGKSGYIRRFMLGKSIDYASRVVITASPYTANRPEDQQVDFYHTGLPLAHVCSQFTPFIIFWLKNWFKNNFENHANSFLYRNDNGENIVVRLKNPHAFFNESYIEEHIENFVSNPYTRFDRIEVPLSDADMEKLKLKKYPYAKFEGRRLGPGQESTIEKDENNIRRDLTWTDLIYMAAVDQTADKHVWITRYPILDYLGSFTSRIAILSTRDTVPMKIGSTIYKNYPLIDLSVSPSEMDVLFRDTVTLCPLYLSALGADHDGDQITCKGVFSQEANEECERILTQKGNLLNVRGGGVRTIDKVGAQTLYTLTKFMK